MAIEITSGASLQIASQFGRVGGSSASTGVLTADRSPKLSNDVEASPFSTIRRRVSVDDTRSALSRSVVAGNSIINALKALEKALERADQSSIVSSETSLLAGDGTRISAVNIQSEARNIIKRIDSLVEKSAFDGINLISSRSQPVALQTSSYGGAVNIQPQPLDSQGLGLGSIDLLSQNGIDEARHAVRNALATATSRQDRLEELQRAIGGANLNRQGLARVLTNGQSEALPSGSLVNLFA